MTYTEWLDEIECYSCRWERLVDDLKSCDFKTHNKESFAIVSSWLEAAYKVGFEEGRSTLDTI